MLDPEAENYNPNADGDGNFRMMPYDDSNANTDDGSCVEFVIGCTDETHLITIL